MFKNGMVRQLHFANFQGFIGPPGISGPPGLEGEKVSDFYFKCA